jgi:hypothetical protein
MDSPGTKERFGRVPGLDAVLFPASSYFVLRSLVSFKKFVPKITITVEERSCESLQVAHKK